MSVRAIWTSWRNHLLASPRFQSWATRFPLTRPVARSEAAALFDLTAGFVYSQLLLALVESGVMERLAQSPQTEEGFASAAKLDRTGTARLIRGGCALGLLERLPDRRIALGRRGAALLGNPGVLAMIRHHRLLYADLADPLALLRGETEPALSGFWAYGGGQTQHMAAAYSQLMSQSQHLIAATVLDAVRLDHGVLMDVGGGEGAFLAAALGRYPRLHGLVFDLPAVAERAAPVLAPFGHRARAIGGDVFSTPLPQGADTVSLIRVLHDHDDAPARALVGRLRAALPQGGRLIIAEPMAGMQGSARAADAYFGLYFAAMGRGRTRTPQEIARLCEDAGFTTVRVHRTPLPLLVSVLTAKADAIKP